MLKLMRSLVKGEEGQGLVEYALIIAIIAVALIASLKPVRTAIEDIFEAIKTGLDNAGTTT